MRPPELKVTEASSSAGFQPAFHGRDAHATSSRPGRRPHVGRASRLSDHGRDAHATANAWATHPCSAGFQPASDRGLRARAPFQALRRLWLSALTLIATTAALAQPLHDLCVIVGAPGEASYADGFSAAARAWVEAAERSGSAVTILGLAAESLEATDRQQLRDWLADCAGDGETPLWIVYLGHGTFDGREARLNLRGPDVTAGELASWLEPVRRPLVFVHGGSASAPFIPALSGPNRIVITATRSGHETNYARFGERFAAAVANPAADIDQDGQTTVLEAFVTAAQQVQAFYAETGRLATEHALIDDNGDRQGTPADWFRGTRVQRRPEGGEPDGDRARLLALVPTEEERQLSPAQREQRERWERDLAALRLRKAELPEERYYHELERILRELAAIYGDS